MFLASVERLIVSVTFGSVILILADGVGVGSPRVTNVRCVVEMPVEVDVGVGVAAVAGVAVTAVVCVGVAADVAVGVDGPPLPQPIVPDTNDNTSSGITISHNFFTNFLLTCDYLVKKLIY